VPASAEVPCPVARAGGKPIPRAAWRKWVVPDLSLVAAAVTLFYSLTVFDGSRRFFRDSDTGWHIRTGEAILETATLPRADPYSFSRAGQRWFAWEWGADVLMGAAHRWAGCAGVALLYGLAIAGAVWLWFRLHWTVGGNFFLACAMAAPMLSTTSLHWLARPHVLSWVLLLAAALHAERVSGCGNAPRFGWWYAAGIFLFGALWANLHASFFLAPAIALVYGAGHWLRPWLWDLDAGVERRKALWFGCAAGCALAGSFLNPYGWNLHRHLVSYLGDTELLARVGEFQSFNFHVEGAFQILLALALAALGGVLALGQRGLAQFALAAVLIVAALRSARGLPVVALLVLPLANGALTRGFREARGLAPRLRQWMDGFFAYSDRLRAIDAGLGGRLWVPFLLALAVVWIRLPSVAAGAGFPPEEFPTAAAAAVEKLPQEARLLAPDKYGGYLIYRFQGKRKVFFDGRSDFYGAKFMKDYIRLMQVRPGWKQQLERWGFSHALLPNDYSLVAALEEAGWRRLYQDGVATLLERPGVGAGNGTC